MVHCFRRNVKNTGKFCAGIGVDACQEDSGGPLVRFLKEKYNFVYFLYLFTFRFASWMTKNTIWSES